MTDERRERWETAALAVGREVDRNALRAYMAVADAEQQAALPTLRNALERYAAENARLRTALREAAADARNFPVTTVELDYSAGYRDGREDVARLLENAARVRDRIRRCETPDYTDGPCHCRYHDPAAHECTCATGSPEMYEGPASDCPQHGDPAIRAEFERTHPGGKNTLKCTSCYRRKDREDFRETPWHGRAARCASCEGDVWRRGFEERTHWELVQAREKLRMWQRYASYLRYARFRETETLRFVTSAGTVVREVRLWY